MEYEDSHSKKNRDYWTYLEENYKEVSTWPTWMRGESSAPPRQTKTEDSAESCDGRGEENVR